jgi:hypothetical protein
VFSHTRLARILVFLIYVFLRWSAAGQGDGGYSIKADGKFSAGEMTPITIAGPDYKGLLVVVKQNKKPVGTWINVSSTCSPAYSS